MIADFCYYLNSIFLYKDLGPGARTDPKHLEEVLSEHRKILDGIASRDPDKAEAAARDSVRAATSRFMGIFAARRRANRAAVKSGR